MLGSQGLNIHESEKMYQIKALPGEYSALCLISMMYAAFQQFAPGTDVGMDFSKEFSRFTGRPFVKHPWHCPHRRTRR